MLYQNDTIGRRKSEKRRERVIEGREEVGGFKRDLDGPVWVRPGTMDDFVCCKKGRSKASEEVEYLETGAESWVVRRVVR